MIKKIIYLHSIFFILHSGYALSFSVEKSEKLYSDLKSRFKKDSIALLKKVRDLEKKNRNTKNQQGIPSNIAEIDFQYNELKKLNQTIKDLLLKGIKYENKSYDSILQAYLNKPEKKQQFEDELQFVEIEWRFFKLNYVELNALAYSNLMFRTDAIFSDIYEKWKSTASPEFFDRSTQIMKNTYYNPMNLFLVNRLFETYLGETNDAGTILSKDSFDQEFFEKLLENGILLGSQTIIERSIASIKKLSNIKNKSEIFQAVIINRLRSKSLKNNGQAVVSISNKQIEKFFKASEVKNWKFYQSHNFLQNKIGEFEYVLPSPN